MRRIILYFFLLNIAFSQKILIPMDMGQRDHLKAYGLAFWILENNVNVEWLLNFRGGTFMTDTSHGF